MVVMTTLKMNHVLILRTDPSQAITVSGHQVTNDRINGPFGKAHDYLFVLWQVWSPHDPISPIISSFILTVNSKLAQHKDYNFPLRGASK